MTATSPKVSAPERVCPTCGELLHASRCPQCMPIEPARSYSDRATQPVLGGSAAIGVTIARANGARRTGEWMDGPEQAEPQTRRAHPTLVRAALAEAEQRAREKVERSALVPEVGAKSRSRISTTSQRVRTVTPPPTDPDAPTPGLSAFDTEQPPPLPGTSPITRRGVGRPLGHAPQLADLHEVAASSAYEADTFADRRRTLMFWLALGAIAVTLLLIVAI